VIGSLYLAASSADITRAKYWRDQLVLAGVPVISTWIDTIMFVGAANPRDATRQDRRAWARRCLQEVQIAELLWLLVPPPELATIGAWVELGYALGAGAAHLICSGDTLRSIFPALAEEHERDADAFAAVLAHLREQAVR
jgi:hypothetical protein